MSLPLFLCGVSISRHVDSRPQRRFKGLMTVWLGVCVFCRPSNRMSFTQSWSSAPHKLWHFYKHLKWAEQAWDCLQILWDSMQHAPGTLRTQLLISRRSAEAVPIVQLSSNCVSLTLCDFQCLFLSKRNHHIADIVWTHSLFSPAQMGVTFLQGSPKAFWEMKWQEEHLRNRFTVWYELFSNFSYVTDCVLTDLLSFYFYYFVILF